MRLILILVYLLNGFVHYFFLTFTLISYGDINYVKQSGQENMVELSYAFMPFLHPTFAAHY